MKYYFLTNENLSKLNDIINEKFQNSSKPAYYHHSLRVANYSYQMGKIENIDLNILVAAALIHDIGKTINPGHMEHVASTKVEAPVILKHCGYNEEEIKQITDIAISHHPKKGEVLKDIYQQILFDADNMDCIGAFGIIRWYNGISADLKQTIADAQMYIEYFSFENRDRFFYNDFAHEKANHLIQEGVDYANKLITFCEASIIQNDQLLPI